MRQGYIDPVVSNENTISIGPPGGGGPDTLAFLAAGGPESVASIAGVGGQMQDCYGLTNKPQLLCLYACIRLSCMCVCVCLV